LPESFAAAVALVAERREALLHTHLTSHVHLVAFEPGRIEIRPTEAAPADLANSLGRRLSEWTGARWVVAVSGEPGEDTLAEQAAAIERAEKEAAAADPLVRAVLDTFPGATIEAVRPRPPAAGDVDGESGENADNLKSDSDDGGTE
jgi:DNA polymerase-3 subunit gamma/tau